MKQGEPYLVWNYRPSKQILKYSCIRKKKSQTLNTVIYNLTLFKINLLGGVLMIIYKTLTSINQNANQSTTAQTGL